MPTRTKKDKKPRDTKKLPRATTKPAKPTIKSELHTAQAERDALSTQVRRLKSTNSALQKALNERIGDVDRLAKACEPAHVDLPMDERAHETVERLTIDPAFEAAFDDDTVTRIRLCARASSAYIRDLQDEVGRLQGKAEKLVEENKQAVEACVRGVVYSINADAVVRDLRDEVAKLKAELQTFRDAKEFEQAVAACARGVVMQTETDQLVAAQANQIECLKAELQGFRDAKEFEQVVETNPITARLGVCHDPEIDELEQLAHDAHERSMPPSERIGGGYAEVADAITDDEEFAADEGGMAVSMASIDGAECQTDGRLLLAEQANDYPETYDTDDTGASD